jgi:long-chain fatty acid transport protein
VKKLAITGLLGLLTILISPASALSSGFYNGAQGAKAFSLGNAFVAQADDPTAIYFNPAGIVQLEGIQVSLGTTAFSGNTTYKSDIPGGTVDMEHHVYVVPFGYLTYKVNDTVSLGLGSFSNFGLSADWPDSWLGRFVNGATNSRLASYAINPVIAIRPYQKISFAVGPVFQYVDFKLQSRTLNPFGFGELNTTFSGSNWGVGFNVGMLAWITDNIKFGFSYRSKIRYTFPAGKLAFSPQVATPIPGLDFYNTGLQTSLKTPALMMLGLSWQHAPFTVEFGVQWTEWSSFRELAANFNSPVAGQYGFVTPKAWRNTWEYHVGIQYTPIENLYLRAGFIYDMGAVPAATLEPLVPFGDRKFYCFGVGYTYKGLTLDACYSYMDGNNSAWNNSTGNPPQGGQFLGLPQVTGRFEGIHTNIVLLTVSYKF